MKQFRYHEVFRHYGVTFRGHERRHCGAIGSAPGTGERVLVLVLHADLFVDDSVVDDIQAPRWRDRADTAAGRDFAAALDEAYAHSLPVHPYLRLQRGAGRFVFVRYCNNRGRPIVGRLALWNGRQYRVELGDF